MATIPHYEITGLLGRGTFATVYRAVDARQRHVAIKQLDRQWIDHEEIRRRFLAEATMLQRLHDPRIVQVYDIGMDRQPYYAMELADAGSLDDVRRHPLPVAHTLLLCAEGAQALHTLHSHGIVHRDVAPRNLLLAHGPNGPRLVLSDLGAATTIYSNDAMRVGTPSYVAPEQAAHCDTSPACDIYSMGAVTFAALVGNSPFPSASLDDAARRNGPPARIAARIGAPPQLDDVMAATLALDPSARPSTAAELASALTSIAHQMSPVAISPRSEDHIPTAPVTTMRSHAPAPAASTPSTLLNNYLGDYREPTRERERHEWWWYLWVFATGGMIIAVSIWILLYLLG